MERIQHNTVSVNGINMHVAEIGDGPAVLFLHGFPELWYTWRHQMLFLASKGYRAIAPDLRGYGDTDAPPSADSYSVFHIVGDLVALLDALQLPEVFLVGHDWGAIIAWNFCMFRPDRIKALVNMSVVISPRHPTRKPLENMRETFGDDFYICRFQQPGEAEEVFGSIDPTTLFKAFLTNRDPRPPRIPHQSVAQVLYEKRGETVSLPPWLTQQDIKYYATKFGQSGFTGGLNYYRNFDRNWELTAAWSGSQIQVPVKFIVGDQDLTYHFPGVKELIHEGGLKKIVPNLQQVVVMEGVAHYINQEKPEEVNNHILEFIQNFH
ncbi:PREDICTED: bifunctional epoxide hydrolase 2-like [Ipomoea nil]|uniref:bifunctional epoxide hydrolase 2-like n=1 Tax=Ipomoea nil TaxID=35883 RepID=UPI000900C6B3|nr:PREDICTED: bifunctional epoxide hydrolase 2-like [Ipomoea nil]